MDEDTKKRLVGKGWSQHEIDHAANIMSSPKDKHLHIKKGLHMTGFWFLMLGLVMINLLVIIFAIPLMLLVPMPWVYIVTIIAGLCAGLLFNWMVLEIEHLEHEHHTIAMLMIPMLTLIDVIIIYVILEGIKKRITFTYNADPVVFFFGLCFILPYFVWFMVGGHKKDVV